jgi:lipoprotein NlpD
MGKLKGKTTLSAISSYIIPCRKFFGVFLSCVMILSCSGHTIRGDRPRGVYHRVKSGETLSLIAMVYHVDLQELAEINNINNPDLIEKGSVIFIPEANQIMDDVITAARLQYPPSASGMGRVPVNTPKVDLKRETSKKEGDGDSKKIQEPPPINVTSTEHKTSGWIEEKNVVSGGTYGQKKKEITADQPVKDDGRRSGKIRFDKKRFAWPVKGKVVSKFGFQPNRMYYNGIRIEACEGTTVQAAADGRVIFSAPLKGYGETIIIQHEDQYATVYTHLGIRAVQEETRVNKGDRIAFLGNAGDQRKPYIEFEIRYRNKARNPLFLLP